MKGQIHIRWLWLVPVYTVRVLGTVICIMTIARSRQTAAALYKDDPLDIMEMAPSDASRTMLHSKGFENHNKAAS